MEIYFLKIIVLQAKLVLERNRTSRLRISIANYSSARARADNYSCHVELFIVVASCSVLVSSQWCLCLSIQYKKTGLLHGQVTIIGPKKDVFDGKQGSCGGSIEFVCL